MGGPNRLTKPASASDPVERGKVTTIGVNYTVAKWQKANEIILRP
jgi:hypothetical protein